MLVYAVAWTRLHRAAGEMLLNHKTRQCAAFKMVACWVYFMWAHMDKDWEFFVDPDT